MIDQALEFLGTTIQDVVGGGILWLLELLLTTLPMSPFLTLNVNGLPAQALGWLNWFVDVNGMLGLMGLWVAAVLAYMVATAILHALRENGDVVKAIGIWVTSKFGV